MKADGKWPATITVRLTYCTLDLVPHKKRFTPRASLVTHNLSPLKHGSIHYSPDLISSYLYLMQAV